MSGRSAAALLWTPLVLAAAVGCARPREIDVRSACAAAPPEVEKAWAAYRSTDQSEECGFSDACWRRKGDEARALRDRHPESLLAHQVFAKELWWSADIPDGKARLDYAKVEYRRLAARHPRNPAYPYLLSILELDAKKRRNLIAQSLALDPRFPWAHQAWAREVREDPGPEELAQARQHVEAFAKGCPAETAEQLKLLNRVGDRSSWQALAPAIRERVTPESDRYTDLPALWAAEFKFADPAEYPALRERVRAQVEAVRSAGDAVDRHRLEVLRQGYELAGDLTGLRAVDDEWLATFPCALQATKIRSSRFDDVHGKFNPNDSSAAQRWLTEAAKDQAPWLELCPGEMLLWEGALFIARSRDGSSPKEVEDAADRVLALVGPAASESLAKAYLEKRVRLDRVDGLIQRASEESDKALEEAIASGVEGQDRTRAMEDREESRRSLQALRVRLAVGQRDPGAARLALQQLASQVEAERAAKTSEATLKDDEAALWALRGDVEELSGRLDAALADYGEALSLFPGYAPYSTRSRAIFEKLHGSGADFDAWLSGRQSAGRTLSVEASHATHRPLPELALSDSTGRLWTAADLRGRATLINFWSTWCGWCKLELPSVQILYDRTRGRSDARVVTINLDENPGLIEPFMAKEKYTFPVLIGRFESYRKFTPNGIPVSYVVDKEGTIVEEQLGFGGNGERWLKETQASLVAAGAKSLAAD